ncbi:MAG: glycine cleavage system protein R [Thalassotalea sp.]
MKHIIISFISNDRPGIVDLISNTIKQHQGNWQTSSLHHLSGLFAGIIEVTVAADQQESLCSALKGLPELNLQIEVAPEHNEVVTGKLVLELTANDRSGIINSISSVIHQHNGNLIKLVSSQQSAPHSGQLMFNAKAHITINETNVDDMIAALENIADDLMVDISR